MDERLTAGKMRGEWLCFAKRGGGGRIRTLAPVSAKKRVPVVRSVT